MLISDFSFDFSIAPNCENASKECGVPACKTLGKLLAEYYINEWVLSCSNDYRIVYDEYSKGISEDFLSQIIQSTPRQLKEYEDTLVSIGAINIDIDSNSISKTIANAKLLFQQDKLIIKATTFGASLPLLKQFFLNHRLCDSRSVAVIKRLLGNKKSNRRTSKDVSKIIAAEFRTIELNINSSQLNNNEFLSNLYNLLTSSVDRFDVSFLDSWNAIRASSESNNIRSSK